MKNHVQNSCNLYSITLEFQIGLGVGIIVLGGQFLKINKRGVWNKHDGPDLERKKNYDIGENHIKTAIYVFLVY